MEENRIPKKNIMYESGNNKAIYFLVYPLGWSEEGWKSSCWKRVEGKGI
jgi:hypothetical protein